VRPIYVVFFVLLSIAEVAGEDGREFARDRWKVAFANSESWRQYDCLIKVSTFADGENGDSTAFPDETTWCRFAVDWDKQEFFCLSRIEKEMSDREPHNGGRTDSRFFSREHLLVKSSQITRNVKYPAFDVGIGIKSENFSRVFDLMEIPLVDLRCVGMLQFPAKLSSHDLGFEGVTKLVGALSSGKMENRINVEDEDKIFLSRSRKQIHLTSHTEHGPLTEVIKPDSLLRTRYYLRAKETGSVIMEESVSWFEVNGVNLPTEVLFERHYTSPKVSQFTSISVYWRSINEPLDRSLFEPKFLDNRTLVLKSSDVELFKAGGVLNP